MSSFEIDNKDFEHFINVIIYINGMLLIEKEEDKILKIKLNLSNFKNYKHSKCNVFKTFLEDSIKKYVIKKIKENNLNIIELSKKYNISVKNILYTIFINNRIDNIDILWHNSSLKEFEYIPVNYYMSHNIDILYLKIHKFKFKKSF